MPTPGTAAHGHRAVAVLAAAAALVASLALAAAVDGRRPARVVAASPAGDGLVSDAVTVDGTPPTRFPASRLGVGPLALDQPAGRALAVLGPPTATAPDIGGSASTWWLGRGARLTVSAWADNGRISGLSATVPPGSPVRVAAYGGVVVGATALADAVAAWGPGYTLATSPEDDYVVAYLDCAGGWPVVVKFDQPAPAQPTGARPPRWDQPVTGLLVAYADGPAPDACAASLA